MTSIASQAAAASPTRYPAQAITAGGLKYPVSLVLRYVRRHEKLTPWRRQALTRPEGGGIVSEEKGKALAGERSARRFDGKRKPPKV